MVSHRHLLLLRLPVFLNKEPMIERIPRMPMVEKPLSDVSHILAIADKNPTLHEGV
jgi:hypothetical protein